MKYIVVTFALLLAGVSAKPEGDFTISNGQERIVTSNIERAIEDLIQTIQDAGLDPFAIDSYTSEISTPIGGFRVWIWNLLFTGLSDIVIDYLNYTITISRLRINLVLPRISLRVGSAGVEVIVLGRDFSAELGGSLEIIEARIKGDMRFTISLISGISIRSVAMEFELKDIKSDLSVHIQNRDLSDDVNRALGETVPKILHENRNVINDWLSVATFNLLDRML